MVLDGPGDIKNQNNIDNKSEPHLNKISDENKKIESKFESFLKKELSQQNKKTTDTNEDIFKDFLIILQAYLNPQTQTNPIQNKERQSDLTNSNINDLDLNNLNKLNTLNKNSTNFDLDNSVKKTNNLDENNSLLNNHKEISNQFNHKNKIENNSEHIKINKLENINPGNIDLINSITSGMNNPLKEDLTIKFPDDKLQFKLDKQIVLTPDQKNMVQEFISKLKNQTIFSNTNELNINSKESNSLENEFKFILSEIKKSNNIEPTQTNPILLNHDSSLIEKLLSSQSEIKSVPQESNSKLGIYDKLNILSDKDLNKFKTLPELKKLIQNNLLLSKNKFQIQENMDFKPDLINNTEIDKNLSLNFYDLIKKFSDFNKEDKDDSLSESNFTEKLNIVDRNGEHVSKLETSSTTNLPHSESSKVAIQKVIDLADHLKSTQGGSAKLQIHDSQFGKINLHVEMKNNHSLVVHIQTEHESVKKGIEDKVNFLKQSLHTQKIELTDFKVNMLEKSTQTQNQSQSQFNSQNQQEQNSQNIFQNPYFQGQNGQNFEDKNDLEKFETTNGMPNLKTNYKNMQKNSITNIQRSANGSIKVLA